MLSLILLSFTLGHAADASSDAASGPSVTFVAYQGTVALNDPWKRLAFARSLMTDGSSADEAAVALLRLTTHDVVGAKAREELYTLAIREPIRSGWRDIYDALMSIRDLTPDARRDLAVRSAASSASDPGSRPKGLAALQSAVRDDPRRADVRLAYAHALMAANRPDEARAMYQGTNAEAAVKGALLAMIAVGRLDEAEEVAAGASLDARDPVVAALKGTHVDRVRILIAAGYLDAAVSMLLKQDAARADVAAWSAIAEAQLVADEPRDAAATLARLASAHPTNGAVREAWTGAILEAGDLDGAKRAAGTNEGALQLVYAVQLVSDGGTANVLTRAEEIERAVRAAPRQPQVVRQYAELLLAQEKADAAWAAISPMFEARPNSNALIPVYDRVAIATQHTDQALAAHRQSTRDATPSAFWPRVGAIAGIQTVLAEQQKAAKRYEAGIYHYMVALAIRPDAPEYYSGLGGMLWSSGRISEGKAAYLEALALAPQDVAIIQSAVGISLAGGDVVGAQQILDRTSLRGTQISKLREDVEVANVLQAITRALDSGAESDARAAFQDLLIRFPDNPRILHALGDTLLRAKKPLDALSAYQRARGLNPRDPWLAMAEATCHIELGDYAIGNKILDELGDVTDDETRKALKRVRARALRAEGEDLWHDRGQPEAAFERFAQALALDAEPWSLVALGGLYLERRQPGAALAFYDEALSLDPQNGPAIVGRVNSLQALGRLDDARASLESIGRRKAGTDIWDAQEDMEIQVAITDVDRLLLRGDLKRARETLDEIGASHPDSPHVDAAMGSLLLAQGQPSLALQRAEHALERDPTHGRALSVAFEAGMSLRQMPEVVKLFEAAIDGGGGESARRSLDNALFAERVQRASDLARDGRRVDAQRELDDILESMTDNPDHWALLGGAYLAMNITSTARDVYERGLELDPKHVPSIIGIASTQEATGNIRAAANVLAEYFARTADPRVGLALAQIEGRIGRWKSGLDTLEAIRSNEGTLQSGSSWANVAPFRIVPLPSGRAVDDTPPPAYEGLSSRVSVSDLVELEEELSEGHYPYGDVGGGFFGRTGEEGTNRLDSGVGGASLDDVQVGFLRLRVDVLSVALNNGVDSEIGASGSVGFSTPARRTFTLDARVGTSPIGFSQGQYLTWLGTARFAVDPHITIGADSGRVPVTDSLLSWAGAASEDGPFGLASFTWGGGWLSFVNPNLTDGGARFRTGFVEALQMDGMGRQELTGWVGQTMGSDIFKVRIGGNFTWLTNDRQVEEFVVGEAGVFSPRSYVAGVFTGDVKWTPTFSGTAVCASGAIGVQRLEGDRTLPYFEPGSSPAYAIGAGLGFPISDDWRIGLDAKTESASNTWRQQSVLFRIGYLPPWTGRTSFVRSSEIHGTGIGGMTVCR